MQNKISFNRPKLYTNLLSDSITGNTKQISVHSMVILDEFTLRTPDALLSGKATEEIIKNCCPEIIEPENLLICDIQQILANIKIATTGMKVELLITCPKCSFQDPYEINLSSYINSLSANKWFTPLIMNDLIIYFSPPTYKQFNIFSIADFKLRKQIYQISKLNSIEGYEEILISLIAQQKNLLYSFHSQSINKIIISKSNNTVTSQYHIQEWFKQLDIQSQNEISSYIAESIKQCYLPNVEITCSKCQEQLSVPIDLDFCTQFRNKLITAFESEIIEMLEKMNSETKNIKAELLKLIWYMRGSISYSEAYYLTAFERESISKIIQENIETSKKFGMPII